MKAYPTKPVTRSIWNKMQENVSACTLRYDITECLFVGTHVKISQLVTSLQTSRQQDVFALLVPSLSTSCSKLVDNL